MLTDVKIRAYLCTSVVKNLNLMILTGTLFLERPIKQISQLQFVHRYPHPAIGIEDFRRKKHDFFCIAIGFYKKGLNIFHLVLLMNKIEK